MMKRDYNPFDNYLMSLRGCEFLTAEEEKELVKKAQAGDKRATNKVVRANLRFVVDQAKRMRLAGCKADIEDLIGAGNIGLTKAVAKYDAERGARFITCAALWIRAEMNEEAGKVHAIHLPHNCQIKLPKILAAESNLPKNMEQSEKCEIIAKQVGATKNTVKAILDAAASIYSLDSVESDDEDASLYTFISDQTTRDPLDEIIEKEMKENFNKVLNRLPKDESMVLERHHGLDGQKDMSLDEIAGAWGKNITREGIRQKELRAINRFRESDNRNLFEGVFDMAV